jgi:hypothetical protein
MLCVAGAFCCPNPTVSLSLANQPVLRPPEISLERDIICRESTQVAVLITSEGEMVLVRAHQ